MKIQINDKKQLKPPYEDWELKEDVKTPQGELELDIFEFLRPGEEYIKGETMRERAKELGAVLGERHARTLLERQDELPEEWREFYLVFPGTVWRYRDGFLLVPCLYWDGGRWDLVFGWLEGGWLSDARIVSLRKSTSASGNLGDLEVRIKKLEDFKERVESVLKL